MCWRKLSFFTLVATIAACAAVGTLSVQVKEYEVPTPKSRPHDPAVAPDGSLWYTGQAVNKLGRLDPQTGQFKEYPLKTPGSGPHGLVADAEGNIWFTAIAGGYVGKLDPQSGEISEYRPSSPTEIDPHTPALDHSVVHQRRDELCWSPGPEDRLCRATCRSSASLAPISWLRSIPAR